MTLDAGWVDAPKEWRGPFLPEATAQWADFPALKSLFDYDGSGVMPGRTWVIAPDKHTLEARWNRLISEKDDETKERLFHPHLRNGAPGDKHIRKKVMGGIGAQADAPKKIIDETGAVDALVSYSFRSFDRQWIIADARLINQPNPSLWSWASAHQLYLTAPDDRAPENGPALTFTAFLPDLHHYNGRGGRVLPLWRNSAATVANLSSRIVAQLAETYGHDVVPEDLMAYIAGVLAHPAFTTLFANDLKQPGLRVPITANADLFARAVALGREVIWLHTYGERFDDLTAKRPKGPPRMASGNGPIIPVGGAIPPAPEPLPETMEYDAATRRLRVGKGHIDNVAPEVWAYEVSGKHVVHQWFSYRKRDRTKPPMGDRRPPSPLSAIQPDGWLPEYTSDLMNLLHVLGRLVLLETKQAELLNQILEEPLLSVADLGLVTDNGDESEQGGSDGQGPA